MNTVATKGAIKIRRGSELERLKTKAAILDELIEFIDDRYLGYLMQGVEGEKNIPLVTAKKIIRL